MDLYRSSSVVVKYDAKSGRLSNGPSLQHAPQFFTHAHLSIRRNIGSVEDGDVEETRMICRIEWLLR